MNYNYWLKGLALLLIATAGAGHAFGKSLVGTMPDSNSYALQIDSNLIKSPVFITSYDGASFYYDPAIHQIYLYNSGDDTFDLSYTYYGNTEIFPSIPYTAIPSAGDDMISFYPKRRVYLDPSTLYNANYDIDQPNAKLIAQDVTLYNYYFNVAFACEFNNQMVAKSVNRILMDCITTTTI